VNYGKTNTQVPFNVNEQGYAPDKEKSDNAFQTLSYTHIFSDKKNKQSRLLIGLAGRQGSLDYIPSDLSPVNFIFAGDSTLYALSISRRFSSYGIRSKYDLTLSKLFSVFAGFNYSSTKGSSDFTSRDSAGNAGPSEFDKYSGSDFGVFTGMHWNLIKQITFDAGIRYDQHIAPDAGLSYQFSPRLKLNYFIDKNNSGYIYFGRLFMPTNIEALNSIASNITTNGSSTLPERDSFYEAVFIHKFQWGLNAKFAGYYKDASPGLDDETIGSSAIKTPVNIEKVITKGIELSLSYSNSKFPVSGFLNTAIIHTYGSGAISGGFLPLNYNGEPTDLDHDQRLTIAAGINYNSEKWFADFTADYGSGLTNGNPDNIPYGTGLFDFNSGAHVKPWIVLNLGAGYMFKIKNNVSIEPSIYINNILDKSYLLKGAFFSGASYGERRNVVLKLEAHI
jgi:outer membrane receptor for ferrienterochelin and colicin